MENKWFNKTASEVKDIFNTDLKNGLTNSKASENLEKFGFNELKAQKKVPLIIKFLEQFKDFMIIILIIAAIVSGAISIAQGEKITDSVIILIVVIANAIIEIIIHILFFFVSFILFSPPFYIFLACKTTTITTSFPFTPLSNWSVIVASFFNSSSLFIQTSSFVPLYKIRSNFISK